MDTMWAATRDVPLSVLISPPPAGTFGCYPQIPNDRPANGCHPSYLTPMALLQSARAFSDASAALANDTIQQLTEAIEPAFVPASRLVDQPFG